ncbi:hypothetical protein G6F66_015731 [Rhizopus arrhizus]|nr:hypothetical protein G6F66_015731 [Rhizopus arrhizus]
MTTDNNGEWATTGSRVHHEARPVARALSRRGRRVDGVRRARAHAAGRARGPAPLHGRLVCDRAYSQLARAPCL